MLAPRGYSMNGASGSVFDELAQSVFGTLRERFTHLEQENRELQDKLAEAEESKRRLEDELQQRAAAVETMQANLRASAEQALGGLEESYQRIVGQQKAQQDQFEERLRSVHASMEGLFGLFQQEQASILKQLTGDLSRDLAEVSQQGRSDLSSEIEGVRERFLGEVANIVDGKSPAAPAVSLPGGESTPVAVEEPAQPDEPMDEMEVRVDEPAVENRVVESTVEEHVVENQAVEDLALESEAVMDIVEEAAEIAQAADEAEDAGRPVPTQISDYLDRAAPAEPVEREVSADTAVLPFLAPVAEQAVAQGEPGQRVAAPVADLVSPGEYLPIDAESVLPSPPSWDLRVPAASEESAAAEEAVAGPAMAVEARRGRPMATSRMIVSPFPNFTSLIRFEAALKQIEAIRRFRSRNFRSGRFEVTFDHDPDVSIVDAILGIPDHRLELISSGEDSYAFRLQG